MDFWDSRSRVIALIDDLRRFAPSAFAHAEDTGIRDAWVVIDGEPTHMLHEPAQSEIATLAESVLPQAPASPLREMLGVSQSDAAPAAAGPFVEVLKATIEQLVLQGNVKALPDGKPFLFPDGIKSLELSVKFGADAGVTLKINEGQ